jgi:hypothetical protein
LLLLLLLLLTSLLLSSHAIHNPPDDPAPHVSARSTHQTFNAADCVLTASVFVLCCLCCCAVLQSGGPTGGSHQGRHTTEDGPGMQSILERNDLDELMAMVRIWASMGGRLQGGSAAARGQLETACACQHEMHASFLFSHSRCRYHHPSLQYSVLVDQYSAKVTCMASRMSVVCSPAAVAVAAAAG